MPLYQCDGFIAPSEFTAARWRAYLPENARIYVIAHGVADQNRMSSASPSECVGFASRLTEGKGVELALEIFKALIATRDSVRCSMAGAGPLYDKARKFVQENGLWNRVELPGFVEDMGSYWATKSIALFCSSSETFGLGLLEPIASGVPVVAFFNGSGSDEVIATCRGVVGIPYGQVDAVVEMVISLLTDSDKRASLVEQGREDLRNSFSKERMLSAIKDVYQEI